MEFGVLGPLEVSRAGRPVPVRAGKLRVLLAALLLRANQPVPAPELIDWLWDGASVQRPRDTLYQYVMRLRRTLGGANLIRTVPGGYLIDVDAHRLDLRRFDDLAARAKDLAAAGEMVAESSVLSEALALWRGPALADVPSDSLRQVAGSRLAERRLQVVERRLEIALRLGRHEEVIGELTGLTREHPLRERLWHQLIVALGRSGRQAEALDAFQTAGRLFRDELGVDPGPELRELHRAILAGELRPSPVSPEYVVPAQLPPDTADFVGRAEQVEALRRALRPGPGPAVAVAVVSGKPGAGKTALAVHAAHLTREPFPDGQLFADLRDAEPGAVLGRFLRELGAHASTIPDGVPARAALFRSLLSGRRVLVVLDDAAGEAQVQPLLPGGPGCAVLITSRARLTGLPGAHRIQLDVFEPDSALELLGRLAGQERVAAEPDHGRDLVALCGLLPLAVRIAGARLAARPHWTVGDLVARLAGERHRLDELTHGALDIRAGLDLSYAALGRVAGLMLRRLALLDVPEFAAWAGAAVAGLPLPEAETIMEDLVDAQLLDAAGRDDLGRQRYRLPSLIRLYARERAEDQDRNAMKDAFLTPSARKDAFIALPS